MGWVEARDQVITIIEGTTPPTSRLGNTQRFTYSASASEDGTLPHSRVFWFELVASETKRIIRGGGTWERVDLDIVTAYRLAGESNLGAVQEAMCLDRPAITQRLLLPANWNQPDSTLQLIGHDGSEGLMKTTFSKVEGARLMRMRARVEFESS